MRKLQFHAATFELLGRLPSITEESRRAVDNWEIAHQRKHPAALREWYEIEDSLLLLARYSDGDRPVVLDELIPDETVFAYPEERDEPQVVLRRCADDNKCITELPDAPGYLEFLVENQGCCRWYVLLDGSDDPPVYCDGDVVEVDNWQKVSHKLSAFLFDLVADNLFATYRHGNLTTLIARERLPTKDDLAYLRTRFAQGPPLAHPDALIHYRFFSPTTFLKIGVWPEDDELEPRPQWELRAIGEQALEEAARFLWPLSSLAENLRPQSGRDETASRVLARLGRHARAPKTALDFYQLGEKRRPINPNPDPVLVREAIELFSRAIELGPRMVRAYERRIFCYEQLQDHEAIVADYTHLLKLRKKDLFWLWKRAEHLSKLGRHDAAAAEICALIELDPEFGDYREATLPFEKAGRMDLVMKVMEHWRDHPPRDDFNIARFFEELGFRPLDADQGWKSILEGRPGGRQTAEEFRDYELRLGWRGATGRTAEIALRGVSAVELAMRIGDVDEGSWGLPALGVSVKVDEPRRFWNSLELSLAGHRLTVRLNGILVVDNAVLESASLDVAGPIAILPGDRPLEVENMRVRPLARGEHNGRR